MGANMELNILLQLVKNACELHNWSQDGRLELIKLIWDEIDPQNQNDNVVVLIDSLRKTGLNMETPSQFLEKFSASGNAEAFEAMLQLVCENGTSMEVALELVEEMNVKNLERTERSFAAVIHGHANHGKSFEKCLEVAAEMEQRGIKPTPKVLRELFKASIKLNGEEVALSHFREYSAANPFSVSQLCEFIHLAAVDSKVKLADELTKSLPEEVLNEQPMHKDLAVICLDLLSRNVDPFDAIIRHLPAPATTVHDTDKYCSFLIDKMFEMNKSSDEIIDFCKKLMSSGKNEHALRVACGYALRSRSPASQDLLKALSETEQLRLHYFWPLFVNAKSADEIFGLAKLASDLKVEFDVPTIGKHVLGSKWMAHFEPLSTAKELHSRGVKGKIVKTALISVLIRSSRLDEAFRVAMELPAQVDAPMLSSSILIAIHRDDFQAHVTLLTKLTAQVQRKSSVKGFDLVGDVLVKISTFSDMKMTSPKTISLINHFEAVKARMSKGNAEILLRRLSKKREWIAAMKDKVLSMVDEENFPIHSEGESSTDEGSLSVDQLEHYVKEFNSKGLNVSGEKPRFFKKASFE